MPLDLRPDKYRINGATGLSELIESKPYIRMVALGRPTIILQAGVYYFESGEMVPKETLVELGLPTDLTKEVPSGMSPPAEVVEVIKKNAVYSIEEQAKRLAQGAR